MLKLVLSLISPGGEIRLLTHLTGEGHLSTSGWSVVSQRNSIASELPVQTRLRGMAVTWGSSEGLWMLQPHQESLVVVTISDTAALSASIAGMG